MSWPNRLHIPTSVLLMRRRKQCAASKLGSKIYEFVKAMKSRTKIQTTNYTTEVERDADKNALQGLITERASQAKLYASVVTEIDSSAQDNSINSVTPKYRVRGFWSMPEETYGWYVETVKFEEAK